MKKFSRVACVICIAFTLVGCRENVSQNIASSQIVSNVSENVTNTSKSVPNTSESMSNTFGSTADISENISNTAEKMPIIVFLHTVYNPSVHGDERYASDEVTFYDSDGNYCSVTNAEKRALTIDELIEEYEAGMLSDSIEIVSKCDISELKANYTKLCDLSENSDFALKEFEEAPAVEGLVYTWYGICFDGDNRKKILFRKKDVAGDHTPNDERASEIYEWILASFKNN